MTGRRHVFYNDALTSLQGPLSPSTAGSLQNGQCVINGASSSVSAAGTDLTLNLSQPGREVIRPARRTSMFG